MSIEYDQQRKTWTVRWREKNLDGSFKLRKKRGFATKREARRFEDEIARSKNTASFLQVLNAYLENNKGYANAETIAGKMKMMEQYASEFLGRDMPSITKADVMKWKNGIADLGLSLSTKNRIITTMKAISRFGADYYDFPDFAKVLKVFPRSSDDVTDIRVIGNTDFELAMEHVKNEVYRRFYIFLYHTGMRRGEALALIKGDVSGKQVSIYKSYRRRETGRKSLKNAHSRRIITIDDKAYNAIAPLLETEGEYIFGEHEPLPATLITRYFDNALAECGLPHYRIHDLRHSFVSNAILNGADIVTVSKYIGHATVTQTLDTYSHIMADGENRLIKILNESL